MRCPRRGHSLARASVFSQNGAKRVWNLNLHAVTESHAATNSHPSSSAVSSHRCAQATRHASSRPWGETFSLHNPISWSSRSPAIFSVPISAPCCHAKHRQESPPSIQLSSKFHGWIENRHWVPNAISLIPPRPLGCRRSDGHHALTNPIPRALPTSSPRPIPSYPIRLTRPLPHPRRASASGFRAYTFLRSK